MGMTRANAIAFIVSQNYSRLEAVTGIVPADTYSTATGSPPVVTVGGYGSAIDDALLALGIGFDALTVGEVTTNVQGYRAALRYYALGLHANVLRAKLSYDVGDTLKENMSNLLKQVEAGMDRAAAEAITFGVVLSGGSSGGAGVVELGEVRSDIYQPLYDESGVLIWGGGF